MRRSSPLTRTLRSLTALATVWCLGCNAFDPLIATLFSESGGSMMVCASEARVPIVTVGAGRDDATSVGTATDQKPDGGVACGCTSCHAPAAEAFAVVRPLPALPHQPATEPAPPPSVARAPLVPPPQQAA